MSCFYVVLFFLMIPRPPRSTRTYTRFPYTTLLRSTSVDIRNALECKIGSPVFLAPDDIVYVPQSKISRVNQWVEQNINRIFPFTPVRVSEQRDRKSTRLNPVTNAQLVCRLLLEKKKHKINTLDYITNTNNKLS